jgi:hypothetical protein
VEAALRQRNTQVSAQRAELDDLRHAVATGASSSSTGSSGGGVNSANGSNGGGGSSNSGNHSSSGGIGAGARTGGSRPGGGAAAAAAAQLDDDDGGAALLPARGSFSSHRVAATAPHHGDHQTAVSANGRVCALVCMAWLAPLARLAGWRHW